MPWLGRRDLEFGQNCQALAARASRAACRAQSSAGAAPAIDLKIRHLQVEAVVAMANQAQPWSAGATLLKIIGIERLDTVGRERIVLTRHATRAFD